MAFKVKDANQNLELNNSNEPKGKTMTSELQKYNTEMSEKSFSEMQNECVSFAFFCICNNKAKNAHKSNQLSAYKILCANDPNLVNDPARKEVCWNDFNNRHVQYAINESSSLLMQTSTAPGLDDIFLTTYQEIMFKFINMAVRFVFVFNEHTFHEQETFMWKYSSHVLNVITEEYLLEHFGTICPWADLI